MLNLIERDSRQIADCLKNYFENVITPQNADKLVAKMKTFSSCYCAAKSEIEAFFLKLI